MRKKKKYNHHPMLYITQPEMEAPEASMQTGYRSPKKEKLKKEKMVKNSLIVDEALTKKPRRKKNKPTETVDQPTASETVQEKQGKEKQKFRDMTVPEKVYYFANLPSQVPKMKCEITTEDGRFIGLISGCQDDIVLIKAIQPPYKRKVKLNEIIDISLLGF